MKGELEVCYHENFDKDRFNQRNKRIASFTTNDPDKSFHVDFEYFGQKYTFSLYVDCFGISKKINDNIDDDIRIYFENLEDQMPVTKSENVVSDPFKES